MWELLSEDFPDDSKSIRGLSKVADYYRVALELAANCSTEYCGGRGTCTPTGVGYNENEPYGGLVLQQCVCDLGYKGVDCS